MMEDELVAAANGCRAKNSRSARASNLIPGPSSSELAIHIGYLRAGWLGLGGGRPAHFPAAIWWQHRLGYVRFGYLPEVSALLYGVKPVVVAVILQRCGDSPHGGQEQSARGRRRDLRALSFLGVNALLILAATGRVLPALMHFLAGAKNMVGKPRHVRVVAAQRPLETDEAFSLLAQALQLQSRRALLRECGRCFWFS